MAYFKKILIILFIFIIIFSFSPQISNAQSSTNLTTVGLNNQDYQLDLDYLTSKFSYYALAWYTYSSKYCIILYCSNDSMIINTPNPTGTGLYSANNTTVYAFYCQSTSMQNAVNLWNNQVFDETSTTKYTYHNSDYSIFARQVTSGTGTSIGYTLNFTLSNFDIKNQNDEVVFASNVYSLPQFDNSSSDISSLSFTDLLISPNDFGVNDTLYLHRLAVTDMVQNGDDWIYYYSDIVFALDNKSPYFHEMGEDSEQYYYSIPKYKFQLSVNTQYVFLLMPTSSNISNTTGLISSSYSENIFDIEFADTTNNLSDSDINILTQQNIDDNMQNISNDVNNMNSSTPSSNLSSDIEDTFGSLSNDNPTVSNIRSGFFSRLTNLVSTLSSYDLSEDTVINIPIPIMFTQFEPDEPGVHLEYITLHSNMIYTNVRQSLLVIVYSFWYFIFGLYLWRFINKIYISISTANILDTFSSTGETITNNMV